jgi:hypothetical protein
VSSVNHQTLGSGSFAGQLSEDFIEDTKTAPAHEAIIDRLVGSVLFRRIPPAKSITDNKNDPGDHPAHQHVEPHAIKENKVQCDASARPKAKSNHPSRCPPRYGSESDNRLFVNPFNGS